MFYVLIILLTTFFFCLAINNKYSNNKNKTPITFLFLLLTILIPSCIAGIRDLSIGTDTRGYLLADFNISSNVDKLSNAFSISNEEVGFISLVFLVTKLCGNIHLLMFIIELLIMIFVVKYALKSETKDEAYLIILFYMFLCFGESLCIMRQHISFAILLYSTRLFKNKKYISCLLLFIIAYLFHSSSICFIFIYFLLYLNNKYELSKIKKKSLIIIVCLALGVLNIDFILNLLINVLHILPSRYNLYINSTWFYSIGGNSLFTSRFFLDLLFILIFLIGYFLEKDESQKKNNLLSLVLMIINLLLYIKSRQFLILSRFSIYFFYGAILLNPLIVKGLNINKKINMTKKGYFKSILNFSLLILIFLTFYGVVILNSNNYNLFPYVSIF